MILLLLLLIAPWAWAAPIPVKDLRPLWTLVDQGSYRPATAEQLSEATTVYFQLDARKHGGQHLLLHTPGGGHLFINGKLAFTLNDSTLIAMDELRAEFGESLVAAIHSPGGLREATSQLVLLTQDTIRKVPVMSLRPPTFFLDFGIIASMILVLFFLVLFRNNPQLTLDYFSFSKVFSSTERNETQLASRITSSENLLFYLFCALLTGFLLSAILYSSGPFFMASRPMQFSSLKSTLWIWTRLSFFILLLLAGKLIIVLIFSTLFDFRDTISFQFFNFLRFILFTAVVLTVISLLFFIFKIDAEVWFERLIGLALVLLSVGSVVVFVKLLGRLRFSLFHLFSYLCISEFIPLVILFKIFF